MIIRNPEAVPAELRRYELKVDCSLWLQVFSVLSEDLALSLQASVKSTEPSNTVIKQYVANWKLIDGVEVKRLYHLRIS